MQRWKKNLWTSGLISAAVLLIIAAVLMGSVRIIDLVAPRYRQNLANVLTQAIEQPVEVGRIGMSWRGFRPTADLGDVVVLDPDNRLPVFTLREIHVPFRWMALLQGRFEPAEVILAGMAVTLEWRADGSFGVQGIEMLAGGGESTGELDLDDIIRQLRALGHVSIEDSTLAWQEFGEPLGLTRLNQFNAKLQVVAEGYDLSITARLPAQLGNWLALDVAVKGELLDLDNIRTQVQIQADELIVQGWLQPLLRPELELRGGKADVQLSSSWQGLQPVEARLLLNAAAQSSWRGDQHLRELPGLSTDISLRAEAEGWQASINSLQYRDIDGLGPVTRGGLSYKPLAGGFGEQVTGQLDTVRVSDLLAWSSVLALGEGLPIPAEAGGEFEQLVLQYQNSPAGESQFGFQADMHRLYMPPTEPLPGVSGLDGHLAYDGEIAHVKLRSQGGELRMPGLFQAPVPLDELQAQLAVQRTAQGWEMATQTLSLSAASVTANGSLVFEAFDDARSPVINLILDFSASDVRPVKPLIPLQPALPTTVGDWLRGAILAGHVPAGEMLLRGPLADFPYTGDKKTRGEFRIAFDVREAELEYAPDWPRVTNVDGHAVFAGQSMSIRARSAEILGVPVRNVKADIPDFSNPWLIITGRVQGDLNKQLAFLAHSPLKADYQGMLETLQVSGPAQLDLKLKLPLARLEKTTVKGDLQLQGAELRFAGFPHPVTQVTGPLKFTQGGLESEELQGQFLGLPASAMLSPKPSAAGTETGLNAELQLQLPQDADKLRPLLGEAAPLSHFAGATGVALQTRFDSSGTVHPIKLSSDLRGMAVSLGAPFTKAAENARDLRVEIKPSSERLEIDWHYAEALRGRVELLPTAEAWRAHRGVIRLGAEVQDLVLPARQGWAISGDLPVLDLEAMPRQEGGEFPDLQALNVHIGLLKLAGQKLRDIRLNLDPQVQKLLLTGPDTEGSLRWERQAERMMLNADFKRLSLSLPEQVKGEDVAIESPPANPATLPGVSLNCEQFILGDETLGSLQLRLQPIANGLRLDLLDLRGKKLGLRGGGEWLRVDGRSSAELVLNFNSNDIRNLLKATGYAESITAEQADVYADLNWAADERGLMMEQLNGKLGFELKKGSLLAVEPGAGRVLSLLSFYALPRRLLLDFSDVMGQGTAFDKLDGQFKIEQGNAYTRNLKVDSPSMVIDVKGRIGLAARDYDQTVTIEPQLSSNIAIAGAVFGGPVLGLGLWLAQELLDEPFEQVATLTYRLGGSWDDPKIEPLKAEAKPKAGKTRPRAGTKPRSAPQPRVEKPPAEPQGKPAKEAAAGPRN